MFAFITVNDPGVEVRVNMDKAAPDQFTVQNLIDFGLDEPIHGYWYVTRQVLGVRYTIVYEPLIPEVFDEHLRIQVRAPIGGAVGEAFFFKWMVEEEVRGERRSVDDIPYRKAGQ